MTQTPVLDLLRDPTHWTQRAYAKDADGNCVTSDDPSAVCWCIYGAINKCYPNDEDHKMVLRHKLREILCKEYGNPTIAEFNDTGTHANVVALLEQAQI
jgi:hypothetical protein